MSAILKCVFQNLKKNLRHFPEENDLDYTKKQKTNKQTNIKQNKTKNYEKMKTTTTTILHF